MPDLALLFGRLGLAALYLASAVGKFGSLSGLSEVLAGKGFPAPMAFAVIAAAGELAGAVGVIAGFQTRTATLSLVAFTLLATLFLHPFWTLEGAEGEGEYLQFMKNLGLAGGFLVLVGPFLARRLAQSSRGGRVRGG